MFKITILVCVLVFVDAKIPSAISSELLKSVLFRLKYDAIPSSFDTASLVITLLSSAYAAYANSYFVNANATTAPGIVDADRNPILTRSEVYSGVYGRASISFYAFNSSGNKGIACGLNNLQKIRDGEPLGGKASAESDLVACQVTLHQNILLKHWLSIRIQYIIDFKHVINLIL